jgi:GntR family transcriptional regulator/MocR family aminotransferase
VRCEADQVLIVSGVQQAITLVARTLLDPEDEVYVEDPGFPRMQAAFASTGAQVSPVRIDEQGFSPAAVDDSTSPCLIGVTPSNHYPLGITMSPSRRMELLEWCALNDTWILEDDYDSEFQYSGRPIAALQGMDHVGRVLYTGTFSKVLFPALRIGYLVVPSNLVSPIKKMRSVADRCTPRVPQMVLTDFITEGYLEEHIRQMRTLYADRQAALIEALRSEFPSFIEIESNDAGLHLVGRLPKHIDDKAVSDQLAEHNIVALPLSFYAKHPLERGGLLLGYAGLPSEQIVETVRTMKDLLEPFLS